MLQRYSGNVDDTLFGNVSGHVAPGSMFIVVGFWWLYNVIHSAVLDSRSRCNYTSRTWYEIPSACKCCRFLPRFQIPLEPAVKLLLGLTGVIIELTAAHWTLYDEEKNDFLFESMNNFSHATMYAFFILSGITDLLIHSGTIKGMPKIGHITLAFAFFIEGFLFYFHLDGRSDIDSHAHSLIYDLCFLISFIIILESFITTPILGLARCYCTILQGTWFYQVAFMLHGPKPWSKTSKAAAMFVPIAFTWHCFAVLVIIMIGVVIGQRVRSRCSGTSDQFDMQCLLVRNTEEEQHEQICQT